MATLLVAPAACQPVLVHGAARRLRLTGSGSVLTFHLDVATVRVGAAGLAVDEQAYARSAPDPLRHDAPAVLAHLNTGHAQALAGCLRARGADVGFVHATGLDAGGLTVLVTNGGGVDTVRLRFPSRVASLDELPVSLSAVLQPGHICTCVRRGPVALTRGAPDRHRRRVTPPARLRTPTSVLRRGRGATRRSRCRGRRDPTRLVT